MTARFKYVASRIEERKRVTLRHIKRKYKAAHKLGGECTGLGAASSGFTDMGSAETFAAERRTARL